MRPARPARPTSLAALVAAFAIAGVVACAQGTDPNADDDDRPDARVNRPDASMTDARPPDASTTTDARPPDAGLPIDGGLPLPDGGIGGACTASNQCPAGECCAMQFMICIDRPDPPIDMLICANP